MTDKNDDDDDHSVTSETGYESLQMCSNNSSNNNEDTYTNGNYDPTNSLTSSLQSDTSVQNGTSVQGLDFKSHVENIDSSEANYKNSEHYKHSNFGNSQTASKSVSDGEGLKVDTKDQPQSIEDAVDSNITNEHDSEKDRQIALAARDDTLQSRNGKEPQNTNRNINTSNNGEVTILFNPISQDKFAVCKQESMEENVEIMNGLWQIPSDTSQFSMSPDESIDKNTKDNSEYKEVKSVTRGFPLQVSALSLTDHNSDNDLNMANLSLILSSIYVAAGDSHEEEEVGDDQNDARQNNNVSTGEDQNENWQSEASKTSIYGLKQPWLVMDLNHSDHGWQPTADYTEPVNFRDSLKMVAKNHFYKLIPSFPGFHKKANDEDFKKTIDLVRHDRTWNNPHLERIIVGMVYEEKSLSIVGQDGGGNGEGEDSGDDGEGSHQNTNANTGENSNDTQQGGPVNDHQQYYQSALADDMHQSYHHQSTLARHSVVQCSEDADPGHTAELVGLPRSSIPLEYDWEFAAEHIRLLLSSIARSGGRIHSLLPNVWTIDICGQTMMISCTQNIGCYRACLHKSIDEVPESVAMWRDYLISLGLSSTTVMIDGVPTIVAFGGVSVLASGDDSLDEASRLSLETMISKIRRARNNSDNDSVQLVSRRDPESDRSTKENTVIEYSVVPTCQNSSEGNINTFEVTCAGRQASSQPVVASVTPPCYSGPGCANTDEEKFAIVTRRINQGAFNLVNQSMSSSQLHWIHHENSSQQLENQMFFSEPYVLELMPATHMQGATAMISVLQDTLSIDYEEFSRAYNAPYSFPLSHFGEALPSNHNLEDNRSTHPPYHPVTCRPLPASNNNYSNMVFSGSQQELKKRWSQFGQRLRRDQILCLIHNCISQCPELCDMIERLLEDPSFHQSLMQILLEQRQPCAVVTLPAVNIGVIAAVPAVLNVGLDHNDPEKWSKEYKRLEAFPLCNEPYLELPDNSLDSSVFDPHDINCEPLPASDVDHSKVMDSGSKHGQEAVSLDPRSTLDQILDSIRQLTPQCPGLCEVIEQLLVEDPDFHRSLIKMLSKDCYYQPCAVTTLPAINMGGIGAVPVLCIGLDNDLEKWSRDYKMPEAFLPPPHMRNDCGLPYKLLECNPVDSQDVTCKAEPALDALDQISSAFDFEETTQYVSSTSSSSDEREKFIT